jgi:hypothetical protein
MDNFWARSNAERDDIIEFLKSLRTLPATVKAAAVDDRMVPTSWPARSAAH